MALYTMVACSRNALSAVWRVRREMKRREKRSKPIYRALGALAVQKRSTVELFNLHSIVLASVVVL